MIIVKSFMLYMRFVDQRQCAWATGPSPGREEGAAGGVFTKQTHFDASLIIPASCGRYGVAPVRTDTKAPQAAGKGLPRALPASQIG